MSEQHFKALQRLNRCSFLPGSWDKRFVRDLACKPIDHELTAKQIEWVEKLTHKYRKQLGA